MAKLKDLTGKRFGRLTVLERAPSANKNAAWRCTCECGKEKVIAGRNLTEGKTKSCGCFRSEVSTVRTGRLNKGKVAHNRMPQLLAAKRHIWQQYTRHSKRKTKVLPFLLTFEEFTAILEMPCYYCGKPWSMQTKVHENTGTFNHNGIDRKDPARGYTLDNCVSCCKICNAMKWELSETEFIAQAHKVSNYRLDTLK